MRTEQTYREQTSTEDRARPEKTGDVGMSQFLGRLFEQLSLASWFPAAVLVGNGAVLLQMHADQSLSLAAAVQALTDKPLGILIVVLFALVIATLVTQAFEYETIQLLEGYDWNRGPARFFAAARIRQHATKRDRLEDKHQGLRRVAFTRARQAMLDRGYDRELLNILEQDQFAPLEVDHVDAELLDAARSVDWEEYLDADMRYRLDAIRERLEGYPEPSRILPTRLGNRMRAAEDQMPDVDEKISGFVMRYDDRLPPALREEQQTYRARLDMYCTLVLVFVILTGGSILAFHGIASLWVIGAAAAGYLTMAWVSYQAAITSAKGYGDALQEIGRLVEQMQAQLEQSEHEQQGQVPEARSAFSRLRALFHRDAV